MNKETTLIKRLEAVASRLEDIAEAYETSGISPPGEELKRLVSGIGAAPKQSEANTSALAAEESSEDLPIPIQEFKAFLQTSVGNYVELSNDLGGPVAEQASAVKACFQEQLNIMVAASKTVKPDVAAWQEIIRPMSNAATRVVEIQEANRFDVLHKHLTCVADSMPVMGWIGIEMRAFNHVNKFFEFSQYFGNKIIQEYKDR
ncbi:hypothetical protein JX265_005608 [Neoarthrinium moseri]|uniref:CAP N-terminal domain-containing protein n=1 Tax=Neoarthrinium moseri TaxID=1658444 RepID=A0A9Q0APQ7_9PEZI|nr:hypothetical protein JX265_005608 [Neoarthrinium moseri]